MALRCREYHFFYLKKISPYQLPAIGRTGRESKLLMDDLAAFKNQIVGHGLLIALIMTLISLLALGLNIEFIYGLALGTTVNIINFCIIVYTGKKASQNMQAAPVLVGYIIRMPIYGIAFYLCIRKGLICGTGCAAGFITLHLAIFYLYGIKARFAGARKNPFNDSDTPRQWLTWDEDDDDWETGKTESEKDADALHNNKNKE